MSSTDTISEIPFIHVEIPLDSVQPNDTQKELAKEEPSPIASVLRQIKPKWELSDCEIELFTNGITNKIFCISQQNGNGQENNNGKLVFRVFGAGSEQIIDRKSELANLARLAQAQLAPPVFATFVNGLVCGFSPGECLTVQSVREPSIVGMIAKKLAQMHKIPLTNAEQTAAPESAVFIDKTRQWLCTMPSKFESAKSQRQFDEYFADLDLSCQFASMQSALERINYPLVFSHNDLLIYNILLDDVHNEVHFIDFEYAGPNYQLFDLGNHLCEYAGIEDPDYEQDGPTEAERQLLLRRYFFQFRGQEPTADELKKVATEVMHFEAAAHFFWALWAIQQASLSQIPFDYLQYAVTRHRQFTRLRALLDF